MSVLVVQAHALRPRRQGYGFGGFGNQGFGGFGNQGFRGFGNQGFGGQSETFRNSETIRGPGYSDTISDKRTYYG
uniref:Uncharacterized protein n=1 Tax=Ditylenchus dipsaci TaxID=166011 RepID=A0A915EUK4_9BILA